MNNPAVKVCGMTDPQNIQSLPDKTITWIGFIFYPLSKRYVKDIPGKEFTGQLKRVGVFVNEEISVVREKINRFQLDAVQLHGDESPEYCRTLYKEINVWKAWNIDDMFDFSILTPYLNVVNLFIFDAKGQNRGGNGLQFDWSLLQKYQGSIPFLLSGGINPHCIDDIKAFHHESCVGIDINSGFETSPGIKNLEWINTFLHELSN